MNGLDFIKSKQQSWAKRKGFNAVGGTLLGRGEANYLPDLTDNLFEPLSEGNLLSFQKGNGNETKDSKTRLAKMKALHSSSAIVVNLFQYWQGKDVCPILKACKLTSRTGKVDYLIKNVGSVPPEKNPTIPSPPDYEIKFEEKCKISRDRARFPHSPNIDVVIYTQRATIGIESKFAEPYGSRKHGGLKQKYVENLSLWKGLPNLHELAKEISPDDTKFQYLDAAQLIKHILGLKKNIDDCNSRHRPESSCFLSHGFYLLYLWYDVVGKAGGEHRREIERFAEIAKKDKVKFSHITYQEVIAKLSKVFYDGNEAYCDYLTDRYL